MDLNSAIRAYLKEHKIKQAFIAEKCGWSRERTSCIIKGKQHISADDLRQICEALCVSYDFFYNSSKFGKDDINL